MSTKGLILTRREKFDFTLSGKASETDWLDAEAARLNAISDVNRYRVELFRTQVEVEATRLRTMQALYSAEVQAYHARIFAALTGA